MGDLLNISEFFKKLGFDSSSQWVLYDDQFQKFFTFLAENITDGNILTEQELMESDEMKIRGDWIDQADQRLLELQKLELEHPGLLKYSSEDISRLEAEIAVIEDATMNYKFLIQDMQNTKHSISNRLNDLEFTIKELNNSEKEVFKQCKVKAKQLEDLQRDNSKLTVEAKKLFTNIQAPPLFMHQMQLDQYFLKCDSFMRYFKLYLKDNFKIDECSEFDCSSLDIQNTENLQNLQNSLQYYTLAYINEKAKANATMALVESLDCNQIHCYNLATMARITQELKLQNDHLRNTYDTISSALNNHVQQYAQQRIELALYENTKEKLERVLKRHENDKHLAKIICDALSNAELVWIAIQLDLEKVRNSQHSDYADRLCAQGQTSFRRVQLMRSLNASQQGIYGSFLQEISNQMSVHLDQAIKPEAKSCLHEYEKFGRLLNYSENCMLNKKSCSFAFEQIAELKRIEESLRPFVYDSPLERPMFEHMKFLCPIFSVSRQHQRFEEILRQLRSQFQEKYLQRMDKEQLWRYKQLLWIWFLTDSKRVLLAIDDAKKASLKSSGLGGNIMRPIGGGLKRK